MNCRSTRNWDWLFFSPEYVAQFPECTDVSTTVKKLSLLLSIAKFLEYEMQQGYRADREIYLPPPSKEFMGEWSMIKDYLKESGWEATIQDDGCIKIKPQ